MTLPSVRLDVSSTRVNESEQQGGERSRHSIHLPPRLQDRRSTPALALAVATKLIQSGTASDCRLWLRVGQTVLRQDQRHRAVDTGWALASLDAFSLGQRREPRRAAYTAWWQALPDRRMWASPDEISETLGDFGQAAQVRAGRRDIVRRRRRGLGRFFSDDELEHAIKLFVPEHPEDAFSPDAYLGWARRYYERNCPTRARVPKSIAPFIRWAGSFPAAIEKVARGNGLILPPGSAGGGPAL
jgi:hypothetical protein